MSGKVEHFLAVNHDGSSSTNRGERSAVVSDGNAALDSIGGMKGCLRRGCDDDGSLLRTTNTVRNEAYILGDLLLNPHPGSFHVDFQNRAIEGALHHMMNASGAKDAVRARVLKTLLMFDTGPGGWDQYLDPAKDISRRQRRSPRLSHLHPNLSLPVISVMKPFMLGGLDLRPDEVHALAEQKLRQVFRSTVEAAGLDMGDLVQSGFVEHDISGGKTVFNPRCRAIAAGLFVYAAREVRVQPPNTTATHLSRLEPIHVVRAFFASDGCKPTRVSENVIMDGAIFAQEELGVDARIMVHFFEKTGTGGHWDHKINQVIDGEREVVSC